jgi:hypothetical protein
MNTEWAEVWASFGRVDPTRWAGAVVWVNAIGVRALQGATIYGMQTRGFALRSTPGFLRRPRWGRLEPTTMFMRAWFDDIGMDRCPGA